MSRWLGLTAGLVALACAASFLLDDRMLGALLPVQIGATALAIIAGLLAWRSGARAWAATGLLAAALSWVPMGALLGACVLGHDCL